MNKLASLLIVCIFAAAGAAQTAAESDSAKTSDERKLELRTVVGCLSQTDETYVLTGGDPGAKQFRIVGGNVTPLKGKIGQTVKVVGLVGQSDPALDSAPPYNEGSTTGVGYETIVAQKIKILGGLCSRPGQEWKGEHN